MGDPVTLAWVSLAVAGAGTAAGIKQSKDAADAREKAQEEANAQADGKAAQQSRKEARQDRIRRAKILQGAENTGTTSSSGAVGAISSINTQGAATAGFNEGQRQLAKNASGFLQDAADSETKAQTAGAVGSFGASIFAQTGGFATIFNK